MFLKQTGKHHILSQNNWPTSSSYWAHSRMSCKGSPQHRHRRIPNPTPPGNPLHRGLSNAACEAARETQSSPYLFVLYLEGGQSGLQLVVPHQQLGLHRLLGADLTHLGQSHARDRRGFSGSRTEQTHALNTYTILSAPHIPQGSMAQFLRSSALDLGQHKAFPPSILKLCSEVFQLQQVNQSPTLQICWAVQLRIKPQAF